jgi:hypothetical protein
MKKWYVDVGDMLAYVNDVLHPHGFENIEKADFAGAKCSRRVADARSLVLAIGFCKHAYRIRARLDERTGYSSTSRGAENGRMRADLSREDFWRPVEPPELHRLFDQLRKGDVLVV